MDRRGTLLAGMDRRGTLLAGMDRRGTLLAGTDRRGTLLAETGRCATFDCCFEPPLSLPELHGSGLEWWIPGVC